MNDIKPVIIEGNVRQVDLGPTFIMLKNGTIIDLPHKYFGEFIGHHVLMSVEVLEHNCEFCGKPCKLVSETALSRCWRCENPQCELMKGAIE